jgi:hypothetical protein
MTELEKQLAGTVLDGAWDSLTNLALAVRHTEHDRPEVQGAIHAAILAVENVSDALGVEGITAGPRAWDTEALELVRRAAVVASSGWVRSGGPATAPTAPTEPRASRA